MKRIHCIYLIILIITCSCNSPSKKVIKAFSLEGDINEVESGRIVLKYYSEETLVSDTAYIINSKFAFKGKIREPVHATLYWDNNPRVFLYLDPGKMKISLSQDNIPEFRMTGSRTQNDFELLERLTKPFYDNISTLKTQYQNINDSFKTSTDDYSKSTLEKKLHEVNIQWSINQKKIDLTQIKFVSENTKSFYSVIMLNMLEGNETISLDLTKMLFNRLNNSLKNSLYGKNIIDDIRKKGNIQIGAQAPDFKALDINQQTVTKSQFQDKNVILLDFWASWCIPCRKTVPHLKDIYSKYQSKGLEIIAVSVDTDKQAWMEAIQKDSTELWYHIPVAENYALGEKFLTDDDIFKNYFVVAIPAQILISKDGKVINRWVGTSEDIEASIDSTLTVLFKDQ